MQGLAISAIAKDHNYCCQCGREPYTDGDMCPKCFAVYADYLSKEQFKKKREQAKERKDLPATKKPKRKKAG